MGELLGQIFKLTGDFCINRYLHYIYFNVVEIS